MSAPHDRRTRPYDPKDRDRLDRRTQPAPIVSPGLMGQRYLVAMPGDFGRIVKIIGFLIFVALSFGRFNSSTSLPLYFVFVAAVLALIVLWASAIGSVMRLEFVRTNEFTKPAHFKRAAMIMHFAEVSAASSWVAWLGVSIGDYDWILVGVTVTLAALALLQRSRVMKISQPRNVWEK